MPVSFACPIRRTLSRLQYRFGNVDAAQMPRPWPQPLPPSTLARTHQRGCAARRTFAPADAARTEENSPKQVAPEPDMRASLHPGSARSASSTSAIAGAIPIAAASRSFGCAAMSSSAAARVRACASTSMSVVARCGDARDPQCGEDLTRRHRHTGIDQHGRKRRQRQRRRQHLADAAHQPRPRIEADRNVGTGRTRRCVEPRIVVFEPVGASEQPQRGRSVSRAAAKPGRNRQSLVELKAAKREAGNVTRKRTRRLEHQIVVRCASQSGGRPAQRQRQPTTGHKAQPVGGGSEHHDAFNFVIAVRAPAENAERQIDLGGRVVDERSGQSKRPQPPLPAFFAFASAEEDVSSCRPSLIFASILGRSSFSGLRSRAWFHWNRASRVRPTFQ